MTIAIPTTSASIVEEIQRQAFKHGFVWRDGTNEVSTYDAKTMFLDFKRKLITYSEHAGPERLSYVTKEGYALIGDKKIPKEIADKVDGIYLIAKLIE